MTSGTQPDKGWSWVVMTSSFMVHLLLSICIPCFGIIHSALLEQFQNSVLVTSWAGAIMQCLISSAGRFTYLITFSAQLAFGHVNLRHCAAYICASETTEQLSVSSEVYMALI